MYSYRFTFAFLFICLRCAAQPPVIVISVDTLRADHLSAYGYRAIQTPDFDAFAEHGTVFSAINSQIPLTLPSHTCLFTSTYPFQSDVEENAEVVPAGLLTLASVLQQNGYRTGAFIGSELLAQHYGLDRGFDIYDSPFHPQPNAIQNPYDVRVRRDAALVVRSATQWLNSASDKPPFLFLHFFDLHAPYGVASANPFQPNTAGYDAEIEYVDRVLGRFRKMLVDKGWWDRSLIVLLSDHGESLGEHGETSHGYFIYQSTLWVPLLIHFPKDARTVPETSSEPGGLIDVAPTILDFLHIDQPPSFRGISLLKQVPQRNVYSESMYAHDAFRWSPLRSLRIGNYQYIDAPTAELYNLTSDPHEQKNVIRANAAVARDQRVALRTLLAKNSKKPEIVTRDTSTATASALRSLGYVATGNGTVAASSGPDPKERLREYQDYDKGLAALYGHREAQAVTIFQAILQHDPENTIARYYLGEAYLRLNRREDAIREWKSALSSDPSYEPAAEAIRSLSH